VDRDRVLVVASRALVTVLLCVAMTYLVVYAVLAVMGP
jgi:hypothetical protein